MDLGDRFVEVGDARLWTVVEGWGRPVVLCNGGPGCDDYLAPVAECLLGSCRVMRWEPRGGRSTPDGAYAFPQTIADLEMLREASGVNEWIVAGHSAGADHWPWIGAREALARELCDFVQRGCA